MVERLNDYIHKCKVLKQIQSNKALRYRRINNIQNFITVAVSAFITFIGFSGIDTVQNYVKLIFPNAQVNTNSVQLFYNLLVFLLFLVTIFHLVFQFSSKQAEAEKAITLISNFINEINDHICAPQTLINSNYIQTIGYKYETIIQVIPSNTDKEYLKAKNSLTEKMQSNYEVGFENLIAMEDCAQEKYIQNIIVKSTLVLNVLGILKNQGDSFYLGGGVIRNLIWDSLHNYKNATPIEDIDVIYYNNIRNTKDDDIAIEEKLKAIMPNLKWSVKNQARMHLCNHDEAYSSLEDAVSKWPETASAMLLRQDENEKLVFIAPFKYRDLFRLIVRPTPHFMNKLERYRERVRLKGWEKLWPKLEIMYVDD